MEIRVTRPFIYFVSLHGDQYGGHACIFYMYFNMYFYPNKAKLRDLTHLVLLSIFSIFRLKLEMLTQFPSLNDKKTQ